MIPEWSSDRYWKQIRVSNSESIRRDEETMLVVEEYKICEGSTRSRKEAEVPLPMFGVLANWRREGINSPAKIEMPVKEQSIV